MYFEVYGLELDADGKSSYSVQLSLGKNGELDRNPMIWSERGLEGVHLSAPLLNIREQQARSKLL